MKPFEITSRVGPDGVLKLSLSVGKAEANREVRITVQPAAGKQAEAERKQAWTRFVEMTTGCIEDPTFHRHEQGRLGDLGDLFP